MPSQILPTSQIKKNETPDFCKNCGLCCKGQPGGYSPDQFTSASEIKSLLRSGQAILDWWIDGWDQIYFLRPRKVTESMGYAASWPPQGDCIHLTSRGCSLSWSKRPHSCRALRAFAPKQCASVYDSEEAPAKKVVAFAWHNSQYDLEAIENEL